MKAEAEKILKLLKDNKVIYHLYEHDPVYTSEEAAKVRGVELKSGCKSMILRLTNGEFILANLAADRKIDMKKLGAIANSTLRFATKEEVLAVTNCQPGSVPPFGRLWSLKSFLDESILQNSEANFNIGLLTQSVRISVSDLIRIMNPTVASFSKLQ